MKCLKASGHEVVLTLRVSSNKGSDSFDGSQEVLNEPNGYPPSIRRVKPKPGMTMACIINLQQYIMKQYTIRLVSSPQTAMPFPFKQDVHC